MLAQALLVQQAIKDTTKPFATVKVELYSHDFLEHMDSGRVVRTQIYSVSLLCRLAKTSAFPKVEISTQMLVDAYKNGRQEINTAYAETIPESRLAEPCIVIEVQHPVTKEVYYALADGAHRLYRAWQLGKSTLEGVLIPLLIANECMVP